jgi:S-adenosylmethionine decarboxylase
MRGLHLTADLYQCRCDAAWMHDAQQLGDWAAQAADAVGLEIESTLFHAAGAGTGASATLLLDHSHVCVHTWPGERGATVDVFVAQDGTDRSAQARGLMEALVLRFAPEWTEQRSLDRGDGP